MTLAQLRRRLVKAVELASEEAVRERQFLGRPTGDAAYAYTSGYLQALTDVLSVIRGGPPAWARKYWPEEPT